MTKGPFSGYLSLARSKAPDADAGIRRTDEFRGVPLVERVSIKRMRGRDTVTIRLLITDDHKVVRQGLRMVLELDPDLEVVG